MKILMAMENPSWLARKMILERARYSSLAVKSTSVRVSESAATMNWAEWEKF